MQNEKSSVYKRNIPTLLSRSASHPHALCFRQTLLQLSWGVLKAQRSRWLCNRHSQKPESLCEQHTIWLVYGRIIGHRCPVGILYSNQSTAHCLHQQPEDYCRRRLSQYSLLRMKSYFSASTGYGVPKATICTSTADVSSTPSCGSPCGL